MMADILLKSFFEKSRWESAIDIGIEKRLDRCLLKEMCKKEGRLALYHRIRDNKYHVQPPHEALIPKDNGEYRTVYVNDNEDRVILAIVNDMLFEKCPEMVHPACRSYQKGIGCGKVVQEASSVLAGIRSSIVGYKVDLSKYFDSVPRQYIDGVFDQVEEKFGKSKIIDILREYYHTDTVYDLQKKLIEKYSSLRQGCAVAAFLADAVLYDIDDTLSRMKDIYYVRYSDDILILGEEGKTKAAFDKLSELLAQKELKLNPKKVEVLRKDRWFKFLGFTLKGSRISLSKSRVKKFQKTIDEHTTRSRFRDEYQLTKNVFRALYQGQGEYSWGTGVLPIINVKTDIDTLNAYVMDAIRAAITKKTRIGGLGVVINKPDGTIVRGKGRNVKMNRCKVPELKSYLSIGCMRNALLTSKEAYQTLAMTI